MTIRKRMPVNECSVPACTRPTRTNSSKLCEAHYYRKRRTGDVQASIPVEKRTHGDRLCQADGCTTMIPKGSYCSKHRTRLTRHGDLEYVGVSFGHPDWTPMSGRDNPRWTELPTYSAVHERLRRKLGSAAGRACVECGKAAAHWSYEHGCSDERASELGPYCVHLEHYAARCVSCHKLYDLEAV